MRDKIQDIMFLMLKEYGGERQTALGLHEPRSVMLSIHVIDFYLYVQ
jgi:hypothetical protein